MKRLYFTALFCLSILSSQGQNVFFTEHFNYAADSLLQSNGWHGHSAASTNPIKVTNSGLSWSTTPYIGSGIGNAAAVNNSGSDENRPFSSYANSGHVYVSFLLKVNNAVTASNSGYFFHIGQYADTTTPVFTSISSAFRGRTFITAGTSPAQYKLGLTFNSSTVPTTVAVTADLDTAQTYLVVLKYSFISGASNDSVSLYVFADGANIANEPAAASIGPVAGTASDLDLVQLVALRQYNAGQNITVDGIVARDSWSLLATSLGSPSLLNPANNTFLNVNGPNTTIANINWTAASNASGTVNYAWQLATRAAGNFNNLLANIASNNSGADTSLALGFGQIDALLASLSVPVGDTVEASWRVRAISGTDTAYSNVFDFNLRRGTVTFNISNFNLITPPNFTILPVTGAGTQTVTIRWLAATAGTQPVTYNWLAIAPGGSFNTPTVTLPSGNSGSDTSLTLTFTAIDSLLASLNFNVGDSVFLNWTVRASTATNTQLATQTWRINLFRGGLGTSVSDTLSAFALILPATNFAIPIQGDPTQTANFSWQASTASLNTNSTNYVWLLDLPTGDFSMPVLSFSSNTATSLSLPFSAVADSLSARGVPIGGTFTAKWTVRATNDTLMRMANTSFNISFTRGVMASVKDNAFESTTSIYPNPANNQVTVKLPATSHGPLTISLLNTLGQQVKQFTVTEMESQPINIDLSEQLSGTYFVKIKSNEDLAIKRLVIQH